MITSEADLFDCQHTMIRQDKMKQHGSIWRYCQELCTGRLADFSSGGGFGLLDSVYERDSLDHVG